LLLSDGAGGEAEGGEAEGGEAEGGEAEGGEAEGGEAGGGEAEGGEAEGGAGIGQRSPVTRESRRASRAVAVTVRATAVTGRPERAAVHAPAVHQEA
jgi:hypothetical protein